MFVAFVIMGSKFVCRPLKVLLSKLVVSARFAVERFKIIKVICYSDLQIVLLC